MLSHSVASDTLDPVDCSLPGSSVYGNSPDKNTGVGCQALLQEIPTQGSTQVSRTAEDSLLSEPSGKPKITGVGSLSLLQGIFPTQGSNQGLLHGYVVVIAKKGLSYKLQCSEFNCNGICLSIFSFLKYFGSRIIMLFFWLKSKSSFSFSEHTFITFNSFLYAPFYLISMLLFNLLITPLGLTRVAYL